MEITSLSQLDLDARYTYADYLTWKFEERVELIKGMIMKMTPANQSVLKYELVNGKYIYYRPLTLGDTLHSTLIEGFSVELDSIFAN